MSIQKFFDTLSIFAANILRLKPTSWEESGKTAVAMREKSRQYAHGALKDALGGPVDLPTPLGYLGSAIVDVLAFVTLVWLLTMMVQLFWAMLPFLVTLVFFAWVLGLFNKQGAAVVS